MIELLIVIAIIGVLASLLLATLNAAQRRARAVHCTANLHQLGLALRVHLDDEKAFPLATAGDGLGEWQRVLGPALAQDILRCPQRVPAADEYLRLFPNSEASVFPRYGYNYYGAVWRNPPRIGLGLGGDYQRRERSYLPVPESRVIAPAEMIAFGDTPAFINTTFLNPRPGPEDLLYILFPYVVPQFAQPGVGNWHDGKANMLFCDGHVETAPQSTWIAATPEVRRRWNNDHQPHEESW